MEESAKYDIGYVFTCLLMERVVTGDILVKEKIWDVLLDKNSTFVTSSLVTTYLYLHIFIYSCFSCLIDFFD